MAVLPFIFAGVLGHVLNCSLMLQHYTVVCCQQQLHKFIKGSSIRTFGAIYCRKFVVFFKRLGNEPYTSPSTAKFSSPSLSLFYFLRDLCTVSKEGRQSLQKNAHICQWFLRFLLISFSKDRRRVCCVLTEVCRRTVSCGNSLILRS